jgi:hypothetical protein
MADFIAYVTPEDIKRWQHEQRKDILQVIDREHAFWAGDHFISSEDGLIYMGVPFSSGQGITAPVPSMIQGRKSAGILSPALQNYARSLKPRNNISRAQNLFPTSEKSLTLLPERLSPYVR